MTPQELQRIGIRIYGRKHWRSQLALNTGLDVSTIWRQSHKETIGHLLEVAVRGLLEKHKQNLATSKIVMEQLRKEGRLRPKLRKRKKHVGRSSESVGDAADRSSADVPAGPGADQAPGTPDIRRPLGAG